jgi:hypothetical protein
MFGRALQCYMECVCVQEWCLVNCSSVVECVQELCLANGIELNREDHSSIARKTDSLRSVGKRHGIMFVCFTYIYLRSRFENVNPHSLEYLLSHDFDRKVAAAPVYKTEIDYLGDRAGRSVGVVRLRTKGHWTLLGESSALTTRHPSLSA